MGNLLVQEIELAGLLFGVILALIVAQDWSKIH
jgi:hypothetical protein